MATAGFGKPTMYEVCERLDVDYTFGLSANAVLQRESEELLAEAVRRWEETHTPQRLFRGVLVSGRHVAGAASGDRQGGGQRPGDEPPLRRHEPAGGSACLEATYDEYAMRGESENRNKEFKCGLGMDRLSDHRFMANYFRLYLHAAALNLLVRLRREIADPPPAPSGEAAAAALAGAERKRYPNARRRRDPLGEGHPATWRMLLIKVAASVVVSCRRIVVRLSGSWPNQKFFEQVRQHVCRRPAVAHFWTG